MEGSLLLGGLGGAPLYQLDIGNILTDNTASLGHTEWGIPSEAVYYPVLEFPLDFLFSRLNKPQLP